MRSRNRITGLQRSPGQGLDRSILRPRKPLRPRGRQHPRTRRSVLLLIVMALFLGGPLAPASASIPGPSDLPMPGDACRPTNNPAPEQYSSGTDGMIKPPDYPSEKLQKTSVDN